jgi:hypothetical protein
MRRLAVLILGGCLAAPLATAQAPPDPAQPAPAPPTAAQPAPAPAAPAQPAPAPPAQPPATKAPDGKAPEYDTKAVVTLKGIVEDIHESKAKADHPGLHFILKTATESVEVHTCPVPFMDDLEFTIAKGDEVTVEGSRPDPTGIVIAREITKGQTGLIVRDKTGAPVWTR